MKIFSKSLLAAVICGAGALSASAQVTSITPTTIENGEFAAETVWYNLAINASGKVIKTSGDNIASLTEMVATTAVADENLWCFVGNNTDGYQIYNKAAGTGKLFASPTSVTNGSTKPVMKAEGASGYTYQWLLSASSDLGADTPSFYFQLKGNASAILNDFAGNGVLTYWTQGKDKGSSIQVVFGETTVACSPDNGVMDYTYTGSSAWKGKWTHTGFPEVGFSNPNNNMTLTNGYFSLAHGQQHNLWTVFAPQGLEVSAFEFDFKKNATYSVAMTVTVGDESKAVTDDWQHIGISGLDAETGASFDVAGTNGYQVAINNLNITARRSLAVNEGKEVFIYSGVSPYTTCYRIPAVTTVEAGAHAGRIIAVNDYRFNGGDIGSPAGRIDLHLSFSDDNGETWTEPACAKNAAGQVVTQGSGNTSAMNCAFGDAAIVSDRETGKVLMVSCGGFRNFFVGRRATPNACFSWTSEDGGDTWSDAREITEDILSLFDGESTYGYIDSQFIGSGRMVQSRYVKVGDYYRVYCVLSSQNGGGNTRNWALYSDDFGQTWHILGGVPCITTAADEPKAEELPDGSVLLAARRNGGNRNFNIFRYTDVAKGEGIWGTPLMSTNLGQPTNLNACDGEIMILPVTNKETGEHCYMALQSFPNSTSRVSVSIAWKLLAEPADFYQASAFGTWNGVFKVTVLDSAYSTMCWQKDNKLGFLYEEATYGKAYNGMFRSLSIEDITRDAYEYFDDADFAVRNSLAVAMMEYRIEKEASTAEPGKYVGQPVGSENPDAVAACEAFKANPTIENMTAFNVAVASSPVITPVHNGIYRFTSAHGGLTNYPTTDRFLSHDGTTLNVSSDAEAANNRFVAVQKGDDEWLLRTEGNTSLYLAPSHTTIETAMTLATSEANAGVFKFVSQLNGRTAIVCTNPGNATYPALHMSRSEKVVIWTAASDASQWYMELVGNYVDDSIVELDGTEPAADVRYFDLMGRPVAVPARGSLYITSERRKVVY